MANPVQQGLKHSKPLRHSSQARTEMANPVQQGLKRRGQRGLGSDPDRRNG